MRFSRLFGTLALASALFTSGSVSAADLGISAPTAPGYVAASPFPFEIRGGVFAHDPFSPEQGSVDINGEFLFRLPEGIRPDWPSFLIPRPHIGFTANTAGKTSHGYAGLTWNYDVTRSIFVEASFGGSVNNGDTGPTAPPKHNALGCSVMFRESASLGYRLTERWSVLATVEHISNAGLCAANRGLTNFGGRIGYSF